MDDHVDRLWGMIEPGQQTWDLSPNDVEAIRWVLADRGRLRRERNALLVVLVCAIYDNGKDIHAVLDSPGELNHIISGAAKQVEGREGVARYLDLPSDLRGTA